MSTPEMTPDRVRWLRRALIACFALAIVPRLLAGWGAAAAYDGDFDARAPLAESVAQRALALGANPDVVPAFATGSDRFEGEWGYFTCQMTVLGLAQVMLDHPDQRDAHARWLPAVDACLDWMQTRRAVRFGAEPWGETDVFEGRPHAWHGYLNVALSMRRMLGPSRFDALNDRLTAALSSQLDGEPFWRLATYPGEAYPADLCTVFASIALHGRATGVDHDGVLKPTLAAFEREAVDPDRGLIYQALDPDTGEPFDVARNSGGGYCVYFLAFADPDLSRRVFDRMRGCCHRDLAGFGAMTEYHPDEPDSWGDLDSGPVVFGIGPSASAFALAGARIHGEPTLYTRLYRTATLIGVPTGGRGGKTYTLGGPLGDPLMLAMSSAWTVGRGMGR